MKIYKIRNPEGLYSTGGICPKFNSKGKHWNNIGHIKNHLGQVLGLKKSADLYKRCEIVTFEVTETEIFTQTFSDYLTEALDLEENKEETRKLAFKEAEIKRLQEQLAKLQK